ncbi:MAG: TetR/AcrR family transcriptional regulator C-terminal domain-containing protein [Candidatus Limnocylindria bacterium]
MAITQDDIVRTALRLLDDVGLEGLTLRRLGSELGVSAATLYWHVRDKRALLDLVAEAIVAEHRPSGGPTPGQPWWEWLTEAASAQYRALVGHRDAALVVAGNRPTENSLPAIEQTLSSLVDAGFPPVEALRSVLALGHFVMGSAMERQAEAARGVATETDSGIAVRVRTDADLPILAAAAQAMPMSDPDATFQHGLTLLVAGLRAQHSALTGVPAGHP